MSSVLVGILSETRLFSDGVSRMVNADSSVQLIEADEEALADQSSGDRPNVVLLDGRQDNVLTVCRRLCAAGLKIIVLAVAVDGPLAADALIAGACGILYRSARTEDVVQAIAHVQQGLLWAPRHVVAAAWSKSATKAPDGEHIAGWQSLSAREREVLRHAAAGFANKELADRLAISEATVKAHLTHIFQKVGCHSRAELAAAYHGIAPSDADPPGKRRLRLLA
jgi:two-component system nitrate/nitrite response regulator NarL